jgi:hypothetical protein
MSARNKEVTIDPEAWARNLRRTDRDAPMDDDALKRWLNDYFAFWVICQTKACKRGKRCAGDAVACRDRYMPHVPQRMKFELQATLKAIKDKLPLEGVMRKVKDEMARFDETMRTLERLGYAAGSSSPLPLAGEGGRERSERPGEGVGNKEPSPALASLGHPLPQAGEGNVRNGPRIRLC